MRFLVAAAMTLVAISFSSCSKAQPQPIAERTPEPSAERSHGDEHAHDSSRHTGNADGEQAHGLHKAEGANEHTGNHTRQSVVDSAHHGDGHPKASGHADAHHAHGGHANSTEAHATHQHAGSKHDIAHDTQHDVKRVAIGGKVPDFEVTIAGKKWKFSELRQNRELTPDGTLVLTFWCSFCHSCRHVEHSLDALAKQYQGKAGVVALDASAGETTEGVAEFAKKRELLLPIALDATGAAADILGTRVTTTTVVIDKDGVLRYRGQFGDREHAFAEDALRAVLAGDEVPMHETRQKG